MLKIMREIKFRGLYKGIWVFGNLINGIYDNKPFTQIENSDSSDFQNWTVDDDTVGQFTGLKDKNGKEIYEGDIVKWSIGNHYWEAIISTLDKNKSSNLYAIETFHNVTKNEDETRFTFERSNSRSGVRNDIEFLHSDREVIGNIHQSPELLNA